MRLAPPLLNEALPQFQIQGPQLSSDSGRKGWEGHRKWGHSTKAQVSSSGLWVGALGFAGSCPREAEGLGGSLP